MTAEIAIVNKTAVALAADSAVTIEQDKGQKIFNTVNKLFTLSKYHPVGIMIYGSANFMDVPWESIIKIYRAKLGRQKFSTLKEYADGFISFILENVTLFPETEQEKYFFRAIARYFSDIKREIDDHVQSKISCDKKITEASVKEIVEQTIRKHYEEWNETAKLSHIAEDYDKNLIKRYGNLIIKARDEIFQQLPISEKAVDELQVICTSIFSKDRFARNYSGLVIAGFGEEETFPALVSFTIEAKVNNTLKYKKENDAAINMDLSSCIIPLNPILNAVSVLPKDELAAMAESLVNLTSFKRRISLDAETVGGPIDVAVISKGDGFIWIKRKHYFKPELNNSFFANYFQENGGEHKNEEV